MVNTAIMHDEEIRHVTIAVEEFTTLVEKAHKFDLLVEALLDATDLDYTGKRLNTYNDSFATTLRIIDHDAYMARLHELQKMKEEEA